MRVGGMDITTEAVRGLILAAAGGRVSPSQLQKALAPLMSHVERADPGQVPQPLESLVLEIELLLAEYSNGHWSDAAFRKQLMVLARSLVPASAGTSLTVTSPELGQSAARSHGSGRIRPDARR